MGVATRLLRCPAPRHALVFGALGGVALLTRIDLGIWLVALGVDWLRRAQDDGQPFEAAQRAALAAAAAVVGWLPWGATSAALTGAWLPTSGAASREIAQQLGWANLTAGFGGAAGVVFDPQHVFLAHHLAPLPSLQFIGYVDLMDAELPSLIGHFLGPDRGEYVRQRLANGTLHQRNRNSSHYMENVTAERQFTSSMLSAHTQSRILELYRGDACLTVEQLEL